MFFIAPYVYLTGWIKTYEEKQHECIMIYYKTVEQLEFLLKDIFSRTVFKKEISLPGLDKGLISMNGYIFKHYFMGPNSGNQFISNNFCSEGMRYQLLNPLQPGSVCVFTVCDVFGVWNDLNTIPNITVHSELSHYSISPPTL